MVANRSVPRFLPTLTEVVHPSGPALAAASPRVPMVDPLLIQERVRHDVEVALQAHLENSVANALHGHVAAIAARIREDIDPLVRQAVADAIAAEITPTEEV